MDQARRLLIFNSLLFFSLFLVACSSASKIFAPQQRVTVQGLVSLNAKSKADAVVRFYPSQNLSTEATPAIEVISDEKGNFSAVVPAGDYFVTATAPGYFAYFGRNPIRANADQKGLNLPLTPSHEKTVEKSTSGNEALSGRVLFEGRPLKDVLVQVYLSPKNGFKGPPYASSTLTGADGSFKIPLEPGRYYVVARKRQTNASTGPMVSGDFFAVFHELPFTLETATSISMEISMLRLPSAQMRANYSTKFALLSGVVTDEEGNPVAGFRPCLYDNPRMLDEPVSVGDPTGLDGKFKLKTSRAGTFWIGAREKLGAPPASGERIGFMREGSDTGFEITPGALLPSITLIVRPVP